MVERVKQALRISHNKLDADIAGCIEYAEAELKRLGVSDAVVDAGGPLISEAILIYSLSRLATDEADKARYEELWEKHVQNLRYSYAE